MITQAVHLHYIAIIPVYKDDLWMRMIRLKQYYLNLRVISYFLAATVSKKKERQLCLSLRLLNDAAMI